MANKKLPREVVAIIVGILGVGAYFLFNHFNRGEDFEQGATPTSSPRPKSAPSVTPVGEAPIESAVTTPEPENKTPEPTTAQDSSAPFKAEQKVLIDTFKSDAKFQMNLPENYDFVRLEVDEYAETLYGTERGTGNQLAIIGAPKSGVSPQAAVTFLNENSGSLPMLRGREFKMSGPIKKFTPPSSMGLTSATAIPGEKRGGKMMWALVGERTDKKGTYLFLMEDDARLFEEGEDGLESMMHTFRTTP